MSVSTTLPQGRIDLPQRWYCPSCERLFRKAQQKSADGSRWHSVWCSKPLVEVQVTAVPVDQPKADAGDTLISYLLN